MVIGWPVPWFSGWPLNLQEKKSEASGLLVLDQRRIK